jgi:hypothetical protein
VILAVDLLYVAEGSASLLNVVNKPKLTTSRHNPIRESSNIESGVTVDLANVNQLEVSEDKSYVSIGPGNRWEDVYSELDSMGLGTSGGRDASVGVGGLVTGGGISFFSREHGLVCDNVQSFEVVLADGDIVETREDRRPDLYQALKGGSSNFGIVTRIDMTTFPSGKMWGGTLFHVDTDATRKQFWSYFENFTSSSTDVHAAWIHSHTFVNAGNDIKLWAVTSNVEYTLPVNNPPVFQPILTPNVTLFANTSITSLTDLTLGLTALNPFGSRQLFATMTFRNDAAFMEIFYQLGNQTVSTISNTAGLKWSISYQSMPYSIYSKASTTGGNSLGLEHDTEDLVIVLLTATWDKPASDPYVNRAAEALFTEAKAQALALGVFNKFEYLNYAAQFQDPIAAYGEESVIRLRGVSKKYDPLGIFQRLVPGGFKLPLVGYSKVRKGTWP